MTVYQQDRITQAKNFIKKVSAKKNRWQKHYDIISETKYSAKLKFEPLSGYSTTYGKRYVRLQFGFETWPLYEIASVLIHEATHEMQVDELGSYAAFLAAYVFGKKSEFEKQAKEDQSKFFDDCYSV